MKIIWVLLMLSVLVCPLFKMDIAFSDFNYGAKEVINKYVDNNKRINVTKTTKIYGNGGGLAGGSRIEKIDIGITDFYGNQVYKSNQTIHVDGCLSYTEYWKVTVNQHDKSIVNANLFKHDSVIVNYLKSDETMYDSKIMSTNDSNFRNLIMDYE